MQFKPKQPDRYNDRRDFQTIDNWVASVDNYFALTEAEPPAIYHYLNTIFIDDAATWFRFNYRNLDPAIVTWDDVKTALLAYFVPPNHVHRLRDEWAYIRQTIMINDYYTRLTQLAMQLGGITELIFLDKFIRGFKPKTRTEIELHDPQTLAEAVRLADHFDTIVYRQSYVAPQQSYQEDNRGEPMQLDALRLIHDEIADPLQIDALKIKAQSPKLKKLINEERAHLRSTNACFRCRKQGHIARECPSKTNAKPENLDRQSTRVSLLADDPPKWHP